MLPWFYLRRVYQTVPNSLHYRRRALQTDSLDSNKMNNVTLNVKQPQPSETNRRIKVITNILYSAQGQIHPSGRDKFRNKMQR